MIGSEQESWPSEDSWAGLVRDWDPTAHERDERPSSVLDWPRSADPRSTDLAAPVSLGVPELSFHLQEGAPGVTPSRGPGNHPATVRYPQPGEILARFRIHSLLGRGAFARVYLAEQLDLADRPVALKVTAPVGEEPQNLARLQHTNIVPIYSVHENPDTRQRLICMPYVGGANLAEILHLAEGPRSASRPVSQATGQSLVEALDRLDREPVQGLRAPLSGGVVARSRRRAGESFPLLGRAATHGRGSPSRVRSVWGRYLARLPWWADLEPAGHEPTLSEETEPARRYLKSVTFVQAATWIAARLAEGLEHAHDRGILHRDLKPSNILIAADGTPMLLDFNLSARMDGGTGTRAQLGGTLPYMAPEHLDAFNPEGHTPPEAVGEAADIYALGLILYEMCAGVHPFSNPPEFPRLADTLQAMVEERRQGVPSVRAYNPLASWSLDSILQKCLDADPARRYARAGDLAEDLRRQLDDRPLAFAPEPSLRERLAKWGRRHPRASSSTTVGAVAMFVIMFMAGAAWSLRDRYEVSAACVQREAFTREFRECQLLLNTLSGPPNHLKQGLERASQLLEMYGVRAEGRWWDQPAIRRLPQNERSALLQDLSELIQLRARAEVLQAERAGRNEIVRRQQLEQAIGWLDTAARFDPAPGAALYRDRARYHAALGDAAAAAQDRQRAERQPRRSARDHSLEGTRLLAEGQLERAEARLNLAVELDPQRFWSWFALGLCHFQQRRFSEAALDFEVCAILAPDFAWSHQNRGLALAQTNRLTEARAAFDRALKLNPNFREALVNRAVTCLELDEIEQAEKDLARAIGLGQRDAGTRAAHAEALARLGRRAEAEGAFAQALAQAPSDTAVLVARGFFRLPVDPAAARADFEKALKENPRHERAHLGMAHVLRPNDLRAALEHLNEALDEAPEFGDALQFRALVRAHLGDPATVTDVDRLERVPTPHRLYQAACAMAVLHKITNAPAHAERALELLGRALNAGFRRDQAAADPDFERLRDRAEFVALFQEAR